MCGDDLRAAEMKLPPQGTAKVHQKGWGSLVFKKRNKMESRLVFLFAERLRRKSGTVGDVMTKWTSGWSFPCAVCVFERIQVLHGTALTLDRKRL